MRDTYLLKSPGAERLYREVARDLPIIDFHNHICVSDIESDRRFEDLYALWLAPDPYKHRLMRICGVPEEYITGSAAPFEKFKRFCEIFPYLVGNPVYDWSRMELSRVFGIKEVPCAENARYIYDKTKEMLASAEYSHNGILSRFNVEYQSPVAALLDDLSPFDGKSCAPSLRGDALLSPTKELMAQLASQTGMEVSDTDTYIAAVSKKLDHFAQAGCRFADHSLDAGFFAGDGKAVEILARLGVEYAKHGFTLLLHMGAKRDTSTRLRTLAGPAGGYAGAGSGLDISALAALLDKMERTGGLPDTVLFPLNMGDQAALSVLQGSFSEDGTPSKVQLGPAWWWCDHALGIENTLNCIASFGAVSNFIGMTTDSRSILSFVRHDYFRRLVCAWIDAENDKKEWGAAPAVLGEIVRKICYENAKLKINK